MDLSALIFVALAVAWAVYLIPKALRHHEDDAGSRTVEAFSDRLRVLARREPVDTKTSRLIVPGRPEPSATPLAGPSVDRAVAPAAAPRAAARRAARRRLRVVVAILLAGLAVVVTATLGHLSWAWLAAPAAVLVAWLVACRLMVRREHAAAPSARLPVAPLEESADDARPQPEQTGATAAVLDDSAPAPEPAADDADRADGWDPVSVPLPTYVEKEPAARRTVRTIDLDSTGVWTSGRTAADAALAREADEARGVRTAGGSGSERRAAGD